MNATEAMYARRGLQERLIMARESNAPAKDIKWIEARIREMNRIVDRDGE